MRISKTFLTSSLIYTVAGSLPMASAIILLPFYVAYLSTSDFGALSVYLAFSLLVQVLSTYSYDTSLYIHFHEYRSDRPKLSAFVSSAFLMMIGIGLAVVAMFVMFGDALFRNIFTDKSISFHPYGLLAALAGMLQAFLKVHSNLLQSREKPHVYLWSNVASFGLIALFTIVGLHLFPGSLVGPVGGRLAAAVLMGGWALTRIFREFGFHFNYPLLRDSFSFNFYTFVYQILQWIINYFDRIIMVFFLVLSDVGIYDFAVKCLLVIEFLLNGLHSAFYPKVVGLVMGQEQKGSSLEINRYYHGYTAVNMLLICASILVVPVFIDLFVHKADYRESIPFFPFIALTYVFRSMRQFFLAPYGILKYTRPLPAIYLVVSGLKILLIVALVREWGIYGVIAASLVSGMVESVLLFRTIKGKYTFRFNFFKIVFVPLFIFAMVLTLEPLLAPGAPILAHSLYLVACLAVLGWVYRNELRSIDPMRVIR